MREITCINYMITTACDRLCPDCCCNMKSNSINHVTWASLKESAVYFKGIDRINLTGGEPTLHPQFINYVPNLRELFQCNRLTIETNGWGFKKFPDIFRYFDWIQVSHYSVDSYEKSWDNSKEIDFIRGYLPSMSLIVGEITHIPRNVITGGKICDRGLSENASFYKGKLYPCCVAPGIEGAKGIELTPNWRQEILKVKLPCHNCLFST
jgi:MoaA/NifB/PqqE/SkfB family radical SAM enzyme